MRIAHVMETMEVGGAEVLVASLCRLQREQGHQPFVYCLYRLGILGERLREEGFVVELADATSRVERACSAYRLFRRDAIEAAHFHNAEATILGAIAARAAGVRRAVSTRHGLTSPPYKWKQEVQYGVASRFVNTVVSVCRKAERNLKAAPLAAAGRIVTVYNGCAPAHRTGEVSLFRHDASWKVLQVGRLRPPKDPGCLIAAAGILRHDIAGLQVVFIGDGPLRREMEAEVQAAGLQDSVQFAGERSNIGDWLDQADQFVLASRSEGVPVSILEAMEAGLPVAASDVGGISEVLPGGSLSSVVPAGDAQALAGAIRDAWRSVDVTAERRAAVRRHYQQGFTLARMAAHYQRLYEG